jgi:5'-nucleotidase
LIVNWRQTDSALGSLFVNKMGRLAHRCRTALRSDTWATISREKAREKTPIESSVADRWKHAASIALHWSRSKAHYQDHLTVTAREDMSAVDCFDDQKTRSGGVTDRVDNGDEDLLVISPTVDGRLKDEGRR